MANISECISQTQAEIENEIRAACDKIIIRAEASSCNCPVCGEKAKASRHDWGETLKCKSGCFTFEAHYSEGHSPTHGALHIEYIDILTFECDDCKAPIFVASKMLKDKSAPTCAKCGKEMKQVN